MTTLALGCSQRGCRAALYKGFEYWHERDLKNGTTSWRFCQYRKLSCHAWIATSGDRVVGGRDIEHTHGGNMAKSLARKAVAAMKDRMEIIEATPSAVHASVISTFSDDVLMAMPKKSTVYRILQSHRSKIRLTASNGSHQPAAPSDLTFDIPDAFQSFILNDSGSGTDRVIIMGCDELLDGLARADVWLADGIFKLVTTIFFQLYSVHFQYNSGIHPVGIYCLFTNKTTHTYNRIVTEKKRLIPLANRTTILLDFEKAAMNAFSFAYPAASVSGCYFHLCQSVIPKVDELVIKRIYETDDDVFLTYVHCLPALAFVKIEDVVEAFDILAENKPTEHNEDGSVDNLLTFFESTYVRGHRLRGRVEQYGPPMYPAESWNQHEAGADGIARTTNIVEGWHYSL